jgi:hypothetical protein
MYDETHSKARTRTWRGTADHPNMFTANIVYYGAWITPPPHLPKTATITSISWTANLPHNPDIKVHIYLCSTKTFIEPSNLSSGTATTGQAYVAQSITADQCFQFAFLPIDPTTYPNSSPIHLPAGKDELELSFTV